MEAFSVWGQRSKLNPIAGSMPQILTLGALQVTELCCVLGNDATKNELARSSSVLSRNHSLIIISLLSASFSAPSNLNNILDS